MPSSLNQKPQVRSELEDAVARYSRVFTVVSPPRCCSTAFARVFWEEPSIAFYSHEPFEVMYFESASLAEVAARLRDPLALRGVSSRSTNLDAKALLIKEMPYQVGACFPLLASLSTPPLVFLLRDPRLSIASRMNKKREVGDSPIFPLVETGWELVREQVAHCRRHEIPHLIVRADDFRNHPLAVLPEIFARLGLDFAPEMVNWDSRSDLDIDNLGGDHSHLYRRVLASTGLSPGTESPPPVESFPTEGGFREHVALCLEIYEELSRSPARISPGE